MAELASPLSLRPSPRDHEYHNLGRRVSGHHNHALSFIQKCIHVGEDFLKIIHFHWPM